MYVLHVVLIPGRPSEGADVHVHQNKGLHGVWTKELVVTTNADNHIISLEYIGIV